jgi:hypothetical protein
MEPACILPGSPSLFLERGAKFDSRDMDFCARKKGGACAENLLPILQEFDKRRESP